MQTYRYPPKESWDQLTARATADYAAKLPVIEEVMQNIRARGNAAVREFTAKFDKVQLDQFQVSELEFGNAESEIKPDLVLAIRTAAHNIRTFHEAQKTKRLKPNRA